MAAIGAAGGTAASCVGSVTEDGIAERFVATAVDELGGLDIIVNNAGYTWDLVIQKMSDDQWDAILDVHHETPFQILRAGQPVIRATVKQAKAAGMGVHCPAGPRRPRADAVYLFCIPDSHDVSGQVVICGGGFNA